MSSTPSPSSEELTTECEECGTEIPPVEFALLPGQVRRLPGHCPVCEPKRLAEAEEAKRKAEMATRQEPFRKAFPFQDKRYIGATLDNYTVRLGTEAALEHAQRFAEHLPHPNPSGLLVYGPKGNGKTHLAVGIARQAETVGMTVAWINGKEWLRNIGAMDAESREALIILAGRADLLIIDDLGADRMTGPRAGWLFTVVDTFYRKDKPVMMTTNYNPGELPVRLTPDKRDGEDPDTLDGERIMDRIAEMCAGFVPNEASSYRMEQAVRRAQALKGGGQTDAGT